MPEGPEVKSLVNWLNYHTKDLNINDIKINSGRYKKHGPPVGWNKLKNELPLKISKVNCKGKFIWFEFHNSELTIWNTLGMTGWWTFENDKHNNLTFKIGKNYIYFNDVRNFGTIKICTKNNLIKKLNQLGPDILSDNNLEEFKIRLDRKRSDTFIGSALLDQKVLSGVGNYMRADALYLAKLSPFKEIGDLKNKEIELLYEKCKYVAKRAYKIQTGQKLSKELIHPSIGKRFFFIYGMDYDMYNNKVKTEKLGTRTIHWVPKIQK